jgi:hypothetical protein
MRKGESLSHCDGYGSFCPGSALTGDVLHLHARSGEDQGYQGKKFRGKRNRALELTLNQLINVAAELGWFPSKQVTLAGRRTDLRGFAHEIREVRNYVHPGKRARAQKPLRFTKGVYNAVRGSATWPILGCSTM